MAREEGGEGGSEIRSPLTITWGIGREVWVPELWGSEFRGHRCHGERRPADGVKLRRCWGRAGSTREVRGTTTSVGDSTGGLG